MFPSFCFIAPTNYLQYVGCSRTHLVLAHLVHTNKQYADFYLKLSKQGHFIMMDNSAYELKVPFSPEKLIRLGSVCGADAIVLPDYPFQHSSKTLEAAVKFIPQFKDAGFKTFFVPQSERGDLNDYIEAYTWASQNPDIDIIGCSILGMPNALPNVDPSYARVVLTQMLIDRELFNFDKHHHYLGLNAGPALEIPSLLRMGALTTLDSSGPIWAAIVGHAYTTEADSYQTVSKIKLPVDFDLPFYANDFDMHKRIEHNVKLTLDLFNPENYNKESTWYAQEE